jgi:hypothetical protein
VLGVGCLFLAVEGVTGLLMSAELARPGLGFLGPSRYEELLVDHDAGATALSLWPLALGLALVRVRPRPWTRLVVAAAAACLLAGGALELAATHDIQTFAYGWTSYAPNAPVSSIEHAFHEHAFGLGLAWVGVALATAPLVSTALRGRVGAAAAVAAALALAIQTDVIGDPWVAYCLWGLGGALAAPLALRYVASTSRFPEGSRTVSPSGVSSGS